MYATNQLDQVLFDPALILKDAGLVAASAAAQVGGSAKIIDSNEALLDGVLVADVTAMEVASGDENYKLVIQGSSSPTFASDIANLGVIDLGNAPLGGATAITAVGRYMVPFRNALGITLYRYLRLYIVVAGTVATGINFSAWIGTRPRI